MSKIGYAQSSDIRSRTWDQYRHDMKMKAIRELECIPLLRDLLIQEYSDESVTVVKHGADADLWFSRKQALSQTPDYLATWGSGRRRMYEFQIAIQPNLTHYDFKLSKVGKKVRGKEVRIPWPDRDFFYVVRPEEKVGLLKTDWIMDQGTIGSVAAWGSRPAYRVRREVFLPALRDGDCRLTDVLGEIMDRETLLDAQRDVPTREKAHLATRAAQAVENRGVLTVEPDTTEGLAEVCLLMSALGEIPERPGRWLRRLFVGLPDDPEPNALVKCMLAVDFLYFQYATSASEYRQMTYGEHRDMVRGLERVDRAISSFRWPRRGPQDRVSLEDVQRMLFVVNVFEDWRQDVAVDPRIRVPSPAVCKARRIFESVPDVRATAQRIRDAAA